MVKRSEPGSRPEAAGRMPALFVGHGTPLNAIEDNGFSREWAKVGAALPLPRAVLCVSAHWETPGVQVTAMADPRTIHDFAGFPPALYAVRYPAPGDPELAREIAGLFPGDEITLDLNWGLDHGCWSVLRRMFPDANVPVVQLSLDQGRTPREHSELARGLAPLRDRGVLILGSGNLVHNLGRISLRGQDFNEPFGFDWALEANALFERLIEASDLEGLSHYPELGRAAQQAVPTPEHFLPMLYALALRWPGEPLAFFNDQAVAGSLTMTAFRIG